MKNTWVDTVIESTEDYTVTDMARTLGGFFVLLLGGMAVCAVIFFFPEISKLLGNLGLLPHH